MHRRPSALSLFALLSLAGAAHGETLQCTTINSVPYTIATSGNYCLMGNLSSTVTGTAAAITIAADQVLLDLNDHQLTGPGTSNAGYGISAIDRHDVRVRNGALRGFGRGINFSDSYGGFPVQLPSGLSSRHDIGQLRVEGAMIGIYAMGRHSSVHDNVVLDSSQRGIVAIAPSVGSNGGGVNVLRNQVFNTVAAAGDSGLVYGIYAGASGSVIQDNTVTTMRGPIFSAAIYVSGSSMVVSNNRETDYGDMAYAYSVNCGGAYSILVVGNVSATTHTGPDLPLTGNCNFQ
jgi:hypothetical protein